MATSDIRIRAYNVRFGDCVLLSIGPQDDAKHVLIDFGNAPGGVPLSAGRNDVFQPVARDILDITGGHLHLLVMSHEHLDHMEGFLSCRDLFMDPEVQVDKVWMSIMSAPNYYETHRRARRLERARQRLAASAGRLGERWLSALPSTTRTVLENNVLDVSNRERVEFVRQLVNNDDDVHYLHSGSGDVSGKHGLGRGVTVKVLAPEEDASVYYGARSRDHFWFESLTRFDDDEGGAELPVRQAASPAPEAPRAPPHIDPDEFERLRDEVAELDAIELLAIDKAANNTSLVLQFEVGGKKLLFPGDAENESWELIAGRPGALGPVDMLKVPHHGSLNGIPFPRSGGRAGPGAAR